MSQITLYNADCFEILPALTGIDAVITDPPYGINFAGSNASTIKWDGIANDGGGLNLRPVLSMSCMVISFGANCYPDQLPHRGRWICWDKRLDDRADKMLGSAFELAWTNRKSGFDRMYRVLHGGVVNADGAGRRVHPTQKPIKLMERIIIDFTEPGATVLDPFMGSGTTGVACAKTGRNFIGIEIDPHYFEIAKRRIETAQMQPALPLDF